MSLSAIRSKIFNGGAAKRKIVTLQLDGGEVVDVEVRGLSAGARGRLLQSCMRPSDSGEGDELDYELLTPVLLVECVFVPGTDEHVFTAADTDTINGLDAAFLDPVINEASAISGLGSRAFKAAEGNSGATPVSASATSSPAS